MGGWRQKVAEKMTLEIGPVRSDNSSGVCSNYIEKVRRSGNELSSLT